MAMDLKTWERIDSIYECLLPGQSPKTRVIYFDFGDPKSHVKGTFNHQSIKILRNEDVDAYGHFGNCMRAFEDNRHTWDYL